jgi:hypothetical protein
MKTFSQAVGFALASLAHPTIEEKLGLIISLISK